MQKEVSIIVPIHNDEDTISFTVDSIINFFHHENLDGELIVINDGGTKAGVDIVKEKIKNGSQIIFIDRSFNKGKGYTIREGVAKSSGSIIIFTDADLPYGTQSIKQMYDRLLTKEVDLVLASRNLSGRKGMEQAPMIRKIAHFVYSAFVGSLVLNFSDMSAGLKGMNRTVAEMVVPRLTVDRFAFDIELILLTKKMGFKISELPVVLQQTGKSKNLNVIFDSPQMIKDVLKIAWKNIFGVYDKK